MTTKLVNQEPRSSTNRGVDYLQSAGTLSNGNIQVVEVTPTRETMDGVAVIVEGFDRSPISEPEAYQHLPALVGALPRQLTDVLIRFREAPAMHALIVRGLPVGTGQSVPTPDPAKPVERRVGGIQALSLAVLGTIATPFAYRTQQGGRLFNNIAPSAESLDRPNIGTGSKEPFGWHTEDAFIATPPSYLQLTCMRNPDGVGAWLSGIGPTDLEDTTLKLLREHVFVVGTNPAQSSWGVVDAGPILYGSHHQPSLRFNAVNTDLSSGATGGHGRAIARLEEVLERNAVEVKASPGDLLLVNNCRTRHARSSFDARFDGGDRWLQRVVGYRDPHVVDRNAGFAGYPILEPAV
jgi:L-asparagine oxygenase